MDIGRFLHTKGVEMMRDYNKFRGCLIGGAAGDALGYAVEFMKESEIFGRYGENGITEFRMKDGKAHISDDTQMTLFTVNGLLNNTADGHTESYTKSIAKCYKDWYITQREQYPPFGYESRSWLMEIPELFSTRAPGMTCLSAIESGADGSVERPINTSKGSGGVMRVAPIGLYFCDSDKSYDESDMLGAQTAALTHGHALGNIPAAVLVHIIRRIAENKDFTLKYAVTEALGAAHRLFPDSHHMVYLNELIEKAVYLSEDDIDDITAIHRLGEGWVAEETLAISVYCALKYSDDFERGIIASVNHNGDSDSTGAVTGNILGAYLGFEAIPEKFRSGLELYEIIIEMADDMCRFGPEGIEGYDAFERKYKSAKRQ